MFPIPRIVDTGEILEMRGRGAEESNFYSVSSRPRAASFLKDDPDDPIRPVSRNVLFIFESPNSRSGQD